MSMEEKTIRKQFLAYCEERSKRIESSYMRWLEDCHGNDSGALYCPGCANTQRYVERHNKSGFTAVCGWDESFEEDGPRYCERCGVALNVSPTKHFIAEDIAHLSEAEHLSDDDCFWIATWLGGMGSFDEDRDWPLIAPHVSRLMRTCGPTPA